MSKILIDNRTNLTYTEIGRIIDDYMQQYDINEREYDSTYFSLFLYNNEKYILETVKRKRYFIMLFRKSEVVKDVSDV